MANGTPPESINLGDKQSVLVPPKPWEKQIGESARAFAAFVVYRDLPPNLRNYKAVVEQLYPNAPWAVQKVTDWSKKYSWEYRASEWAKEIDRVKCESQLESVGSMAQRHARIAMTMLTKAEQALNALPSEKLTESESSNLRQFIVEGTKLERQSRELLSGKVDKLDDDKFPGTIGPSNLSGASDDELKRIDQAAQKHLAGEGTETPS